VSRPKVLAAILLLLYGAAGVNVTARQGAGARRLTTLDAVRQFPGYFHLQNVLLRGEFAESGTRVMFRAADQEMRAFLTDGVSASSGPVEIRAQMVDVGRLEPTDPRVAPFADGRDAERWPRPGEELILQVSGVTPAQPATAPTLRALALEPWRFEGQKVTLVGQFRGRNLFGDLPEAPAQNRFQFVLRSADAAVWVMGVASKGRNFNFDPAKRIDTGRWVKVQGTVHTSKGLTWLEGTSIELATPPAETTEVAIDLPPPPPVEIIFTAPAEGEADVRSTERIRLQLSRDLDPATLKDRIRITYSPADSKERGEAQPPSIAFTTNYTKENRALEIRPTEPFERFRLVRMEILEGVKGTDGGAMTPFTLTFTTGGS
jgi:hypothetical protein